MKKMYHDNLTILRSVFITVISVCIIITTSCSLSGIKALSTFKSPIFVYNKYQIMSVGEKKVNIDLVFDATNPNNIAIDSLFVNYEIFIKGDSFIRGKDVRINLLANGKSKIRLPVEVSYQKALKATQNTIAAILKQDKTLPATAKVKIFGDLVSAGYLSLAVSYDKTIDLSIPIPQDTSGKIKNKLEEKLRRLF